MTFRFGPFSADRVGYHVSRDDVRLELTPKQLDLLFYFLDRPGQLVSKEELLDAVWPNANVTENAMSQAISDLREALGDDASAPTFIRTVARRGYRFIAAVTSGAAAEPTPPTPAPVPVGDLDGPVALAVMDFANLAGDQEVAWLGAGIAETVTSDLASLDRFRVVDRWRVVEAGRRTSGSLHDVGRALGARLIVTGGFQRSAASLRITARVVDLDRGDVIADAKVDGALEDVFALQDAIVLGFGRQLGLPLGADAPKAGIRETSSLDAYRAYMEGWLKIESLDLDLTAAAVRDFERAISVDPRYAIAFTGLANAEFVAFEMTRATAAPNFTALAKGIEHARHAIVLDRGLSEAHATLSFLLTSALEFDEARRAAQQAVSLKPDNWRHQYRLGHALWGEARMRAFERTLALYPQFAYARFEMAMVHVARGHIDDALAVVETGAGTQDRHARGSDRFPAVGFHWLLGALRLARGEHDTALAAFDREVQQANPHRLYCAEYAAAALRCRGYALLRQDRANEAEDAFRRALDFLPDHPPTLASLGLVVARRDVAAARDLHARARMLVDGLKRPGRTAEWLWCRACAAADADDAAEAIAALDELLTGGPASSVGWNIGIEPAFLGLHGQTGFARLLERVAARAK